MWAFAFVSIPHRYARNVSEEQLHPEWEMFQFLIGTLETRDKGMDMSLMQLPFQFLIGTLETILRIGIYQNSGGGFNSS